MNNYVGNHPDFVFHKKSHFQDTENDLKIENKSQTNDENEIRELWKSVVIASIQNGLSTKESNNSYSQTACCVADIIVEQFKQRFK